VFILKIQIEWKQSADDMEEQESPLSPLAERPHDDRGRHQLISFFFFLFLSFYLAQQIIIAMRSLTSR
jgi:hypothetical protein